MNVLIVAANPNPKSFTFQAIEHFANGVLANDGKITLIDLFKLHGEDGHMERHQLEDYQQLISEADAIVLAYPIWWEFPPSIMVNWIQKVLEKDFAFTFNENGDKIGLLNNKKFMQIVSIGQCRDWAYLGPVNTSVEYCGAENTDNLIFGCLGPGIPESTVKEYFDICYEYGGKLTKTE